jgi:hypothetical protein
MAKDKAGKKKGVMPKQVLGMKIPKELRKAGDQLIEHAQSPAGREMIAGALTMAAAAATAAVARQRPAAAAARPDQPPRAPGEAGIAPDQAGAAASATPGSAASRIEPFERMAEAALDRLFARLR